MTHTKSNSANQRTGLWHDLRESLTDSERDFTRLKVGRAILLLSVPMVLEMVMESVFAVVDIFFVARLGADSVAAVGLTESLLTLVYAVAGGLAISTTALVSRRIGEKRADRAAATAVQALYLGTAVSTVVALPALLFSSDLLRLMGASQTVIAVGGGYTRLIMGGNAVVMVLFITNAVFRGAGDAAIAMRVLWMANLINIVLDPCLILGLGPFPRLGVTGAALATLLGRGFGVAYQFHLLARKRGRIKILREHLVLQWRLIGKLLRLSLGGIGQALIATTSWIVLMRFMARFGSQALAGYTIAIRVIIFTLLPSWGMANAAATLVGQNLGAGRPDRAERSAWITAAANMGFLGLVALVFLIVPEAVITLFTADVVVIRFGSLSLRVIAAGYLFYALEMVLAQAFNGAGDTRTPMWINLFCFWLVEIPLAYLLAFGLDRGAAGVLWAITLSESLAGAVAFFLFKRGRWKSNQV